MNAAYTYSYLQQLKLYIIKRWCDATVWINFCLQNRYASTLNWLFWLVGWLVGAPKKQSQKTTLTLYIQQVGTYNTQYRYRAVRINLLIPCTCYQTCVTATDVQASMLIFVSVRVCQEHYVNRIHVAPSRSSRLIDPSLISGILNEKVLPIKIHQEPNIRGSILLSGAQIPLNEWIVCSTKRDTS